LIDKYKRVLASGIADTAKKDLVPVCPNCHTMLHKQKPALGIEYLKKVINN